MILCKFNSVWLYRAFALAMLAMLNGGCSTMGPPAFSYNSQERGNKMCAPLFDVPHIQALKSKMPILPGQLPTRDMLSVDQAPSKTEVQAIGALESAIRNCTALRATGGVPTSASEDILQARISRLRYGLYTGEIPFAVYNYGLAQALRKHTEFMVQGEKAYTQGKAAGEMQMLGLALQNLTTSASAPTATSGAAGGWICSTNAGSSLSCY